jgi:hypothetical protein
MGAIDRAGTSRAAQIRNKYLPSIGSRFQSKQARRAAGHSPRWCGRSPPGASADGHERRSHYRETLAAFSARADPLMPRPPIPAGAAFVQGSPRAALRTRNVLPIPGLASLLMHRVWTKAVLHPTPIARRRFRDRGKRHSSCEVPLWTSMVGRTVCRREGPPVSQVLLAPGR